MKNKKRIIVVNEKDYQSIINDLDKKGIQNWNETSAFYFHGRTAVRMVFAFIGVILAIYFLNR